MEALIYILFFIYGLLIGSFLNVCIYRIPLGISVAKGRSMCPSCHNKLGFWDLIPLFSYLFLGGHCRYCQAKISPRYAVVELLTALVFTACYWHFQALPQGILACLLAAVLIVIAFIDLDTREIPDKFHLMILFLAVINLFIDPSGDLIMKISGLFAVSVPMFVIAFFTGGFGGADIKLMAAAGLYLGTFPIIVAFLIAAVLGAVFGIYIIIKQKRNCSADQEEAVGGTAIPFCPALCGGILISLFFSQEIIAFYLSFF